MNRPNIVYIHSHDTGRYVQPYGHAIPTPKIQALAEEGVLFRQCFCANPTCSPSRAALLTGQWAHSCGMLGLVNRGWSLHHPERHLAHTLQKAGYRTALTGTTHVVKDVTTIGYSDLLSREAKAAGSEAGPETLATEFLAQKHDRPFFLTVGFTETHRRGPGFAPAPDGCQLADARFVRPPAPFPDTPETRQDMAEFIDAARTLDHKMGTVFDALDAHGLRDNTLVICTTDHGIAFPGMKCHLTDHGMGVMLILRGPGVIGGRAIDALVSHIDLYPTVCKLVGCDAPPWLQGHSLLPLIRGEKDEIREELFAEVNYHAAYEPARAVRTRRWKYIRRYAERDCPVMPNCDDSVSKTFWIDHGWRDRPVPKERLYDLVFDPHETCNLAGDKAHEDVLGEMRGRLDRWMQQTDDPLLREPVVVPPEGANINDAGGLSPGKDPHYPAREHMGLESK